MLVIHHRPSRLYCFATVKLRKRRGAIQPDYSIVGDSTDPTSCAVVVECKQYWRQSRGNFSDALTDYAIGRPRAAVILVNYGPIDSAVLKAVDRSVRDRAS